MSTPQAVPVLECEMYSDAVNAHVLRTPGRKYPGLLVQGDNLGSWRSLTVGAISALQDAGVPIPDELQWLADAIRRALSHYERVVTEAGFELPYDKSWTD